MLAKMEYCKSLALPFSFLSPHDLTDVCVHSPGLDSTVNSVPMERARKPAQKWAVPTIHGLPVVTLSLCGILRVAMQPRFPTSSRVGQMVLDDWLLHSPHQVSSFNIACQSLATPRFCPANITHSSNFRHLVDTSNIWYSPTDALDLPAQLLQEWRV